MDKNQMEMLSVKSAIERMVQNYINTFAANGTPTQFFDAVERMVASFFVGQQIENNFIVRSGRVGDLEISFTAHKHCTRITFMLPEALRWKIEKLQGTNHNEVLTRDLRQFNTPTIIPSADQLSKKVTREIKVNEKEFLQEYPADFSGPNIVFDPIKAYDRAKKADRNMV